MRVALFLRSLVLPLALVLASGVVGAEEVQEVEDASAVEGTRATQVVEEATAASPTRAAIHAEDARRHVERLASDAFAGRETTKEGARLAAEYLAQELARFGCEGLGAGGSFFQPFAVPRMTLGKGNRLAATVGDERLAFAVEKAWNPFHGTKNGHAAGELVFAGYGITAPGRRWDDYAGMDVEGKIVLVLRKDPGWNDARHAAFTAKLANAVRHKAAALLLCNDAATAKEEGDALRSYTDRIGLRRGAPTLPFAFLDRAVAARLLAPLGSDLETLEGALRAQGPKPILVPRVRIDLTTNLDRTTDENARNVVAWLPGWDPMVRDEAVCLGAHFDHLGIGRFGSLAGAGRIHPGADDNASGTAAVLELAEYFAHPQHRPRRSLVFVAFAGEEMGLLGSSHYVAHPLWPLAKSLALINMDMVGRCREGRVHIGGVGTGAGLAEIVKAANEGEDLVLGLSPGGGAPSDSLPFFRKKIPVLFVFTGMHEDYHRPTDTADKVMYDGLARIARLVRDTVDVLANRAERLVYTEPPAPRGPPRLGIRLDRGAQAKGVRVAGVTPRGPAAKAGLNAGDVIVMLGDAALEKVSDLRAALAKLEAGHPVRLVFLRGDERRETKIVPAPRRRR